MNHDATTEVSDPQMLAQAPLVSVYMPAYRHERFLAEAIDGVVAQRCAFPIELIIGEDCSPDASRTIALDYQQRHPQLIRVLYSAENVGRKSNVARCQAAARGEYVAICEGDDYWCDPTKLARQIEVFRRHPRCSLVLHAAHLIDAADSRMVGAVRWPFRSRHVSLRELILGDGGMAPTASIVVRRSVLQQRPHWALDAPVGDYPLILHAGLVGDVIYIDRFMSAYRVNVPHSWTRLHVPTLAQRFEHAQRIEAMLTGLQAELSGTHRRAIQAMISKYHSDVIVRIGGPQRERVKIHHQVRHKLRGSDRLLAWLASRWGVRLPRAKDAIRKSRTLLRLLGSQFRQGA